MVLKPLKVRKSWLVPSKTPVELLKKVRSLLEKKERWTKKAYARTVDGSNTHYPCDKDVVCYCLVGAVRRVENGTSEDVKNDAYEALGREILGKDSAFPADTIINYNDAKGRKHSQILNLIDRAIKRLQKEGE